MCQNAAERLFLFIRKGEGDVFQMQKNACGHLNFQASAGVKK
ncbi:hypothetical protein NEILACOT_04203 [Neisseria lactamica ATCC 23970]|uniref:Uncharacterized protein n=1 Tax=Neisseria lactamica ATCC 23970 TaxID=546265 RepID=D0W9J1_NEILA|nr:hypothetical protein NEILACOT_04203 [Neisseria lactamica ATCC 23970]